MAEQSSLAAGEAEIRPVEGLSIPDVTRASVAGKPGPEFLWVDPRELLIDGAYQRNLSERSISLIRKIVAGWDWTAFKPPIVVRIGERLHIIDGQHTAIAAASIDDLLKIPVMLVYAAEQAQRAQAFVMHNRDRIACTPTQIHYAMVAAGNEDALTLNAVCDRAGAVILRNPPYNGRWRRGDTMAISFLQALVNRRFAAGARKVVEICVKGDLAPVSATYLKAVEELTYGASYAGQVDAEAISDTLRTMGPALEKEAARFAAEHDLSIWRAMVVVIFRNTRKVRRGSRPQVAAS